MAQEFKELKTGTTTVGLIAKDCVVLASDMLASMGNLAYEEESKKIYKITNKIGVTNAGSVADSLTLVRFLTSHAKFYEVERETEISPNALAVYLSNVLNANRFYPFMAQFILGGINNGPELFEITPTGGILQRTKYAMSGSGTEFAMAILDQFYKKDMPEDDAIKVALRAVKASKRRDIYTGGKGFCVMVIDKSGARELDEREIEKYSE